MRIKVGGKYWELSFRKMRGDYLGRCDAPDTHGKKIRISKDLEKLEELDVILHELLHAADWHKDEEWVEQTASEISHVLWKLGWRKIDERDR
jgi:hypothetical protein